MAISNEDKVLKLLFVSVGLLYFSFIHISSSYVFSEDTIEFNLANNFQKSKIHAA